MLYEAIINRDSGSGIFRDMEQQNRLKSIFSEQGHKLDLKVVSPDSLNEALENAAKSECRVLLVGGGDGTITSAAKLLRGTGKALGILPLGTFNLEARDLQIALDPFEAAGQLMDSDIVDIDLMEVNDECCLCATVIGFYPALAKSRVDFHGKSWWKKALRIVREIATVAVNSPPLDLEITSEHANIELRTRLAAFAPGHYQESIGIIPVRDSLSSGELSAYVSKHLTRTQMLSAAVGYLSGNLLDTEDMIRIETTELTVNVKRKRSIPAMIDGEIVSINMPCRMRILPKALKVLRPREPKT